MKTHILFGSIIAAALFIIVACSPSTSDNAKKALKSAEVQSVLALSPGAYFAHNDQLLSAKTFDKVVQSLSSQTSEQDINKLLYFLRAYSYFGNTDVISMNQKQQLAFHLTLLADTSDIQNNPRFQEQFAVTVYRYFNTDDTATLLPPLLKALKKQFVTLTNSNSDTAKDYALWETLRAYGFLLYQAKEKSDGELAKLLIKRKVHQPLINFAKHKNSIRNNKDWPKTNAYWALAMYRLALPASDTDELTTDEQAIDDAVAQIADADIKERKNKAKDAYTLGYHINTFALRQACLDNETRCRIPDEKVLLPLKYTCSTTIIIRHQDLNSDELKQSCQRLTSQEGHFHQLLVTEQKPTTNDHNSALEVVVFKNWSQYHIGGQLLFDINTDNGGMYLEGTPQKQGNQARFLAFRQWWVEPEFAVWNLNHEYVHYLDGRFVKYGEFGHFPSHMVWWAEGLAEYISLGGDNEKAFKLARENIDSAPDLKTIFATEYKDGLDRTYRWSYLAIRYFAEKHPRQLIQLSQHLKADYFSGYKDLLTELESHQPDFQQWLTKLLAANPKPEEKAKDRLHKLDRYSYRDYLQPKHLLLDKLHRHY